jgi:PAS domain S-box-containing protein
VPHLIEHARPHPVGGTSEEMLRRSLRRAFELSRDGMFLVEGGRIRVGNRFLSEWGGYRGEEIDGTCFASFFAPQSMAAVEALCGATGPGGSPTEAAAVLVRKDGGRFAVGLKAEGCRFDGRSCVLVVVEPRERVCRDAAGWDSDVEGCFASEDALCAPVCA